MATEKTGVMSFNELDGLNAQMEDLTNILNNTISASSQQSIGNNLNKKSEDLADTRYIANIMIKDTTEFEYINGIKMTRCYGSSFNSDLRTDLSITGDLVLEVGAYYIVSAYVKNHLNSNQYIWMRKLAGGQINGQGAKSINPNEYIRIFEIRKADTPTTFENEFDGNVMWAVGTYTGDCDDIWTSAFDIMIGGFSIEKLDYWEKQDIVYIGDSTIAGTANMNDRPESKEVSRFVEGVLMNNGYNRAKGGDTTTQMIARWATDITPLADKCKYCVIQGGINDLLQLVAESTIKANLTTMYSNAIADGMIPIMCTITPFGATGVVESSRVAINDWIKEVYGRVHDIDTLLKSESDNSKLNKLWIGDGTHYSCGGKKISAQSLISQNWFQLIKPKEYQVRP